MQKRWVGSLFLGTWHLPGGGVFRVTPQTRDFFLNRSKEFFKRGLPLPVCLEHQPDVGLSFHDRLAEQTKHTVGHVHDARVGREGELEFLVDGDEEAFRIMQRNKFVSPEIRQNVLDTRTGHRFEGPSIVHLAITPRPVQITSKPHVSLSTQAAVDLESTAVDVSLSSAAFKPHKDKSMAKKPFPPAKAKPDDEETPPGAAADAQSDNDASDDLDAEGGVAVVEADPQIADDPAQGREAQEAAAMKELEHEINDLGVEVHSSAHEDTLNMIVHLISAIKTHKATKACGQDKPDAQDDNQNADQNQNNDNPEAEVAESTPIMMSAATLTPREEKAVAKILKDAKPGILGRIKSVHDAGWIDDAMKKEMEGETGAIKLSAADLTDDFDIRPQPVMFKLDMLERLSKSGKPGPFKAQPAKQGYDPNKPISTSLSQGAGAGDVIEPNPHAPDPVSTPASQEAAAKELMSLCGVKG